jgi:hypothetical protein
LVQKQHSVFALEVTKREFLQSSHKFAKNLLGSQVQNRDSIFSINIKPDDVSKRQQSRTTASMVANDGFSAALPCVSRTKNILL